VPRGSHLERPPGANGAGAISGHLHAHQRVHRYRSTSLHNKRRAEASARLDSSSQAGTLRLKGKAARLAEEGSDLAPVGADEAQPPERAELDDARPPRHVRGRPEAHGNVGPPLRPA
jgi:hypothetical protein